jgi:hypothetical protein
MILTAAFDSNDGGHVGTAPHLHEHAPAGAGCCRTSGTALGARGPVLQQSTATVEPEPEPDNFPTVPLASARDPYRASLRTVHTEVFKPGCLPGFAVKIRPLI